MRVVDTGPLPLLVRAGDYQCLGPEDPVLDDFGFGLAVGYTMGFSTGGHLVSWADLNQRRSSRQMLRQAAVATLDRMLGEMRVYGQPPALMLSFGGIESSLLLLDLVWDELARDVPGEVVVGVPARDVVIVTGSRSEPGLARVRRAIDRVLFAGGCQPLLPIPLIRHAGTWQPLRSR